MTSCHPTAVISDGAQLGTDVEIGAFCFVGPHVTLSDGVRLGSHVCIDGHTTLGPEVEVFAFASLGQPPQHLGHKGEPTRLSIGARTIIREHVTMNTGTVMGLGETRVGEDCLFMAGSHVAHDCVVGNKVIFANNATLGGHVQVGDGVFLGGLCAVHQNARVGRFAFVGGMAGLEGDLIPYGSVMGNRAHLAGLNIIGMKRRNTPRETIHALRRAVRELFDDDTDVSFQDRVAQAAQDFAGFAEVMEVIDFIRGDAKRPLCLPRRERG